MAVALLVMTLAAGWAGRFGYYEGVKDGRSQLVDVRVTAEEPCADWQRETDFHFGACPHPDHKLRLEERASKSFVVCACPMAHAEIPRELWLHRATRHDSGVRWRARGSGVSTTTTRTRRIGASDE